MPSEPISGDRPSEYANKEIFEVHPVILGGSSTDPANKAALTRAEHIQAVRYWNAVIRDFRRQRGAGTTNSSK